MKLKGNKYFLWGLTAFLVICASLCFYYLIFHVSSIRQGLAVITNVLMPVIFGFVLSYLLTPMLNFMENSLLIPLCNKCNIKPSKRRKGVVRGVGIFLTICLTLFLIYSLFYMMLSQIVPSIVTLISNIDTYYNNFTTWINQMLNDNPEVREYVVMAINRYSGEMESWLNGTVIPQASEVIKTVSLSVLGILGGLWDLIIGLLLSVYLLASKEKFAGQAKKIVYALFKSKNANVVIQSFRETHNTFIGFISGKILDSIIIGLLCFIGTSVLRTPYAALISVVIGVTNIIPFFGPYLGALPSIVLIFVVDPMHPLNCVYFAIFILILQQVDGNLIGPKILGDSTGLAGFWVIFSITVFGGFLGVPGMIVGVPVFAIIYKAIRFSVNEALRRRNLPQETMPYMNVGSIDEDGSFHVYIRETKKEKKAKKRKRAKKAAGKDSVNVSADDPVDENEESDKE